MLITPTPYEKNEWSRLAQDAYSHSYNNIGHRFSGAASMMNHQRIELWRFDWLQTIYRRWLNEGIVSAAGLMDNMPYQPIPTFPNN